MLAISVVFHACCALLTLLRNKRRVCPIGGWSMRQHLRVSRMERRAWVGLKKPNTALQDTVATERLVDAARWALSCRQHTTTLYTIRTQFCFQSPPPHSPKTLLSSSGPILYPALHFGISHAPNCGPSGGPEKGATVTSSLSKLYT